MTKINYEVNEIPSIIRQLKSLQTYVSKLEELEKNLEHQNQVLKEIKNTCETILDLDELPTKILELIKKC